MNGCRGARALLLAAIATGCSVPPPTATLSPAARGTGQRLRVQVEEENAVRRVRVEDYVRAAVVSELAPTVADPAAVDRILEVQAIVARTYAIANRGRHSAQGFDLCSTTHCQLYQPSRLETSPWRQAVDGAVRRTSGRVLWHEGAPALALFHADCGGHTSTPVDAWGGTVRPYLSGAPDDGPAEPAHGRWTYSVDAGRVLEALNGDPRTEVGARLDLVTVLDRDPSGRAHTVGLHGGRERLVPGGVFRDVLTRHLGVRTVKSTLFDVRREASRFVFDGRGFGHGVGLCQAGALARIRAGAEPLDVLRRYYPGTSLRTIK
ncbi:MAG TPA: SpoIID/LytB domain-containing protein [Vicinamibacterales bacterium]|nr:SpoIID/LytB domain-containing protein [Vicinamibacterales bacterium]